MNIITWTEIEISQLLNELLDLGCERMGALSKEDHDIIVEKMRNKEKRLWELGVRGVTLRGRGKSWTPVSF